MSTPDAIRTRDGFRVLWRQQYAAEVEQFLVRSNMADEDVRSLKEQVLPFRSIRNKDFSRDVRGRNKASRDKAAGTTKVNQPGGFQRERTRHDCSSFPYFRAD
jgi:hypothetical protein